MGVLSSWATLDEIENCLNNGWTDGLPAIPSNGSLVEELLTAMDWQGAGMTPRDGKQRAVRLVLRAETGERHGSVKRLAEQLDVGVESMRSWVKQAEIDAGELPGVTSMEARRIKALEQEVREMRRVNSTLKPASAPFSQRSSTAPRSDRQVP